MKNKLAVLDFDHTCINFDCQDWVINNLDQNFSYEENKTGYENAILFFAGKSKQQIISIIDTNTTSLGNINKKVFDRFKRYKEEGYTLCCITSSLGFIVRRFCNNLGYHFDYIIGAELQEEYGILTKEIIQLPCFESKKTIFYNMFHQYPDIMIGDSINDVDILSSSKRAIVINKDPRMIKIAIENGWEIL